MPTDKSLNTADDEPSSSPFKRIYDDAGRRLGRAWNALFGPGTLDHESLIEELSKQSEEGQLDPDTWNLMDNLLVVGDLTVEDVVISRAEMIALPTDSTVEQILDAAVQHGHSRFPVYGGSLDNILGVVTIKDALRARQGNGPHRADELARTPIFVSPSKSVIEMLAEMRSSREHMAFVVDEFGGIDGLITMEDLIEQIVGKIEDEHDAQAPSMDQVSPEEMTADAGLPLDEAEERLGPFLTDEEREEEVDTIGGLLFTMSGRIPVRGEQLTHSSGIKFLILDATPRRIRKVRISGVAERLAKSSGSENANAPALAQTQEPEGTVQNDPKDDASGANA